MSAARKRMLVSNTGYALTVGAQSRKHEGEGLLPPAHTHGIGGPSARTNTAPSARTISRQVLTELPLRVVLFLRGICRYDEIRATLFAGGYGPEAHCEGCRLLKAVCEYPSLALDRAADVRARAALSAVHDYVRTHFGRFRAMAERYFPTSTGLFPSATDDEPAAALQTVRALLDWLDRAESAEQNKMAQKLAERGLTRSERRRLSDLVAAATTVEIPSVTDVSGDDRDQALVELYEWYSDWSATARALVKRKDHRCSLGIGEKRAKRAAEESIPESEMPRSGSLDRPRTWAHGRL